MKAKYKLFGLFVVVVTLLALSSCNKEERYPGDSNGNKNASGNGGLFIDTSWADTTIYFMHGGCD